MAQPSTPGGHSSLFGNPSGTSAMSSLVGGGPVLTPSSATSSNNTFLMPNSPVKGRQTSDYRPKITRTLGQRPACLVNASLTYCGNNTIYAFGGFDAYTDEVYNHVLKLDMISHQWSLGEFILLVHRGTITHIPVKHRRRLLSNLIFRAWADKLKLIIMEIFQASVWVIFSPSEPILLNLTQLARSHCFSLPRKQTSHLRRRERT